MKHLVLLTLVLLGIACTPAEAPKKIEVSVPETSEFKQPNVVSVELSDRSCKTDADCATVTTKCSCSCGEGVSKDKLKKYEDLVAGSCKNYEGPYCKVLCNGQVKCLENVCTYINT